ncbi:MAG: membrane protein insertase YidC [Nocardioides sp.]
MEFLGTLGSFIMTPLYYVISAVLIGFHRVFGAIFGADSGAAWVLSIIGLTLVVRTALIPLFVKQIKSSRNMQLVQPRVKELQKKYAHDREKLTQETMNLYKETGTNPFASCLPLIVQMPIFLSLFRIIDRASHKQPKGILTAEDAHNFSEAKLFGHIPLSDTLLRAEGNVAVIITAIILVLAMTATTFMTQRQLMSKNMPADALTGPYAQQQKMLLYVLPLVFGVGGIAFPIGVLIYWTTSNLWTMGQQFYVIRNNPAPGTPAFKAKQERDRAKGRNVTEDPLEAAKAAAESEAGGDADGPTQRVQPKRQTRSQRKNKSTGKPGQ